MIIMAKIPVEKDILNDIANDLRCALDGDVDGLCQLNYVGDTLQKLNNILRKGRSY